MQLGVWGTFVWEDHRVTWDDWYGQFDIKSRQKGMCIASVNEGSD